MTDNEYERLSAVAEGDGMTLGEWVREAGGPSSGFWYLGLRVKTSLRETS
jgi:hypothetical protein